MTEHEATIEANEELAFEYLKQITPPKWTVTRTKNKFERYDVNVTSSDYSFIVENKIRDYDINIYGDQAIIDYSKVEFLKKKDINARIISYFPKNNAIFSHKVKDSDKWETGYIKCRKNQKTREKIDKRVYFLPTTEEYRVKVDIDISDGLERVEEIKRRLLCN